MKQIVLSIMNEKGGVGKTTTATSLAYCLSKMGNSVCLVDFDGQSHSTLQCGIQDPNRLNYTVSNVMDSIIENGTLPDRSKYIIRTSFGVDLVPANSTLFSLESKLNIISFREMKLKILIDDLKQHYDFVIIDTMPAVGVMMVSVLMACDYVIIPTQAEYLSAHGLVSLIQHIDSVKRIKSTLEVLGVVITMDTKNTITSASMKAQLKNATNGMNIKIFSQVIPRSIKVSEAMLHSKIICDYLPEHSVSKAYSSLANEVLNSIK